MKENYTKTESNSWYKSAQSSQDIENYNIGLAGNPNTAPEILEKMIRNGLRKNGLTLKNNWVVFHAVRNPNCPASALEFVINRDVQDSYSELAAKNPNCPPKILEELLFSTGLKKDGFSPRIAYCAAQNPNCPPEALEKLIRTGRYDCVAQEAAENPNCPASALEYIVKKHGNTAMGFIAALNKNIDPLVLDNILKNGEPDQISQRAACNEKCPVAVMERELKKRQYDSVCTSIVQNPNCPSYLLEYAIFGRKLIGKIDEVAYHAARNLNCDPKMLERILKEYPDYNVSESASNNPNCPLKAKIKWMMDTGKIEKEDPSKHIIEKEEVEIKEDPDLQKLRDLISKNMNWYKKAQVNEYYNNRIAKDLNTSPEILEKILEQGNDDMISWNASKNLNCPPQAKEKWMMLMKSMREKERYKLMQELMVPKIEEYDLDAIEDVQAKNNNWYKTSQLNEDYYTSEIASNPNTSPEILKKILEQGNNDSVSCYAAENPNCPAYLLEMVLKRGKDDDVSCYAAENENCPGSALEMVLKRGNNDFVSQYAASNPNCPASALEMVLKRGNSDNVSYYAVKNPNCPGSALEMVLKRGNNDNVSRIAARNPNCPALAKIKWMQATGRIGQFDPSKHIMESDEKEYKEDPDLQKLRDLIASNNSLYKKADIEIEDISKFITKKDFEDIITRIYNQNKEYLMDDDPPINSWMDWIKEDSSYNIGNAIDSDAVVYDMYFRGLPELMNKADLVEAYKQGLLKDNVEQPYTYEPIEFKEDIKEEREPLPWEKAKTKIVDDKKAKLVYEKATQRMTQSNQEEISSYRKELFYMYNSDKELAKKIGISDAELNKKIKSLTGFSITAKKSQDWLNRNIPEDHQWNGIANSSFIGRQVVKPEDLDTLVKKIDVSKDGQDFYFAQSGELLRRQIATVFLAIDSRINYQDLSFEIGDCNPDNKNKTIGGLFLATENKIRISRVYQDTVAHEIGHYLDYKFSKELNENCVEGLSAAYYINSQNKEYMDWINKYRAFVKNLMKKSDIGSEYLQKPTEVFARFIAQFVRWTTSQAGRVYSDHNSYRGDKFTDSDFRTFVHLLQEKSYIDKNFSKQ